MCFYIGIEDLAANALIELLKQKEERPISYSALEEYGTRVVQLLSSQGEKAVLILSRAKTDAMFRNYSDFFEETDVEGKLGIKLKEGKTISDLITEFRGYLPLKLLLAMINSEPLQGLLSA